MPQPVMTFWEHVQHLRNRLLWGLGAWILATVLGYALFPVIHQELVQVLGEGLYATALGEGFVTRFRIAFLVGLLLSLPVFVVALVSFVFPALTRHEQWVVLLASLAVNLLFIGGLLFSYRMILPLSVAFLKSPEFSPPHLTRIIGYASFVGFVFQVLLAFGLVFQFPVLLLALLRLKLVRRHNLIRWFRYFVIAAFVLAAVITPPDVISQVMLALPLILLYLGCIGLAKLLGMGE